MKAKRGPRPTCRPRKPNGRGSRPGAYPMIKWWVVCDGRAVYGPFEARLPEAEAVWVREARLLGCGRVSLVEAESGAVRRSYAW